MLRSPEYLGALSAILARDAPASVERVRADYDKLRKETDPPTFEEFKRAFLSNPLNTSAARVINRFVDSTNVIGHLCQMQWHVVHFTGHYRLLTSDRPIIMTNGMIHPGAHLGLPLSPRRLFLSFHDDIGYRQVRALSPSELLRNCNTKVASQATKYVYSYNDAELRFVAKHLGKREPSTPLETGLLRVAAA